MERKEKIDHNGKRGEMLSKMLEGNR